MARSTVTITRPSERTVSVDDNVEVLFREARRRRHQRWFVGASAIVAAAAVIATFAIVGGGATHSGGKRASAGAVQQSRSAARSGVILNRPQAMAISANGNLLISNEGSNQILERLPSGRLISVAGSGHAGFNGDGGRASVAALDDPQGIAVSTAGTIYVADTGNNRIRVIASNGTISTLAQLGNPTAVAIGSSNVLYVTDSAGLQSVSGSGDVATVIPVTTTSNGEVINELSVKGTSFAFIPSAVAVSPSGAIFIANSSPKLLLEDFDGVIRLVGQTSVLDGGTYVTPAGLAVAPGGNVFVGDYGGFSIDQVMGTSLKRIITFQLKTVPGLNGFRPSGIAVGPDGELFTDTDGVNGGSNRPAVVRIDSRGRTHLLDVGRVNH
jgi:sugar lactone lactonase YvrE